MERLKWGVSHGASHMERLTWSVSHGASQMEHRVFEPERKLKTSKAKSYSLMCQHILPS